MVSDVAFIVYDVGSLAFGPEKDRPGNWLALGADTGSAFVPFVAGAGLVVRGSAHAAIDANKLHHIFDAAKHGLDDVVTHFGSQEAAYRATGVTSFRVRTAACGIVVRRCQTPR